MPSLLSYILLSFVLVTEICGSQSETIHTHNHLVKRTNPVLDSSFGPDDIETQQINDAFQDALELASYAILEDIDTNGPIFQNYFFPANRTVVRQVFMNILGNPANPAQPGTGNPLLGQINITRTDPSGDCVTTPGWMAYIFEMYGDHPVINICPTSGFGHGGIGKDPHQVNCSTVGDTVSYRMTTLGSLLLHEYTHWQQLVSPPLENRTFDYEDGYGPINTRRELSRYDALDNADSYTWYANEVLWTVLCAKTFEEPGDDDDEDPLCGNGVCEATAVDP